MADAILHFFALFVVMVYIRDCDCFNYWKGKIRQRRSDSHTPDFCSKQYFINQFVRNNSVLTMDFIKNFTKSCNLTSKCESNAKPFINFDGIKLSTVNVGILDKDSVKAGYNNCWYLYFQVTNGKGLSFHRYYEITKSPRPGIEINWQIPFTWQYYGDIWEMSLYKVPSGERFESRTYIIPTNKCEHIARLKASYHYMKKLINKECGSYNEGNMQSMAVQVCRKLKNTENNSTIQRIVNSHLLLDNCLLVFKEIDQVDKGSPEKSIKITIIVPIVAISVILILLLSLNVKKIKSLYRSMIRQTYWKNQNESEASIDLLPNYHLQLHGEKDTIMILHRPGCEWLDVFVRDISFIINSYGITVKSPLLERCLVDAEGGIPSYIQRNIDSCKYILIVVTENKSCHPKHKPFEFSLKILNGLAFRENDCSRYIPIYLREYKDILYHIPTFLTASMNCGYRVPDEINKLLGFLKQTNKLLPTSAENKCKIDFFVEKLRTHVKKILSENHFSCCQAECEKGTIKDDVSELWPTETGTVVTTGKSLEELSIGEENAIDPSIFVGELPMKYLTFEELPITHLTLSEHEGPKACLSLKEESIICTNNKSLDPSDVANAKVNRWRQNNCDDSRD